MASESSKSAPSTTGQSAEFQKGIKIRREVLGDAYVDKALAASSDGFGKPIQEYVTEVCWASWGREGLTKKQRSLLNIGILMCLNRAPELAAHTKGAIRNGLTEEEIEEAIRHTMIYAGVPAGVDAFHTARRVIKEMKENGEIQPSP